MKRLTKDTRFISEAFLAAQGSNCCKRHCGAVFVKDGHVIATGYNGTPTGMKNCFEGGCERCNDGTPSGQGYDRCLCVHSEENCVAQCAKLGNSCLGAICYVTMEPCFGCLRLMLQSGISEIIYGAKSTYSNEEQRQLLIKQYIISQPRIPKFYAGAVPEFDTVYKYRQFEQWKLVEDVLVSLSSVIR